MIFIKLEFLGNCDILYKITYLNNVALNNLRNYVIYVVFIYIYINDFGIY